MDAFDEMCEDENFDFSESELFPTKTILNDENQQKDAKKQQNEPKMTKNGQETAENDLIQIDQK